MANEWIEWTGGECPVDPGTTVDVKFPSGVAMYGYLASVWIDEESGREENWWRRTRDYSDNDIVAYRVVQP